MVGATLALSLIGLGAVSALPAKPVEQRQTFVIGAPGEGGTVEWGSGIPNCSPSIPAGVPCISQPFSGGFKIPKEKREEEDIEKRQTFVIGPPGEGGSIGFGEGLPQCSPSLPVNVPCVSPPISGGFKIPKEKREEEDIKKRQTIVIGPPSGGGTIEFGGGLPPCSKSLPVNVPCISIPAGGGFKIPKEKREEESNIEERQTFVIGPPSGGSIGIGKGLPPCSKSLPVNVPCLTVPPSGGFRIPKEKREAEVEKEESNVVLTPRQEIITIGRDVCTQTEILALMYAFTQIVLPYGTPNKAPPYIQSIARDIIENLRLCGLNVGGWTSLAPGGPLVPQPTVPGGPLTPNPTVPGGPLKPDPVNPGSGGALKPEPVQPGNPITPDPTVPGGPLRPPKRSVETDANEKGAAALLASLRELEKAFGSYGSPNIPPQVYGLMVEHVLALQKIPGVVVTGWPVLKQDLGGGTVTLTP